MEALKESHCTSKARSLWFRIFFSALNNRDWSIYFSELELQSLAVAFTRYMTLHKLINILELNAWFVKLS